MKVEAIITSGSNQSQLLSTIPFWATEPRHHKKSGRLPLICVLVELGTPGMLTWDLEGGIEVGFCHYSVVLAYYHVLTCSRQIGYKMHYSIMWCLYVYMILLMSYYPIITILVSTFDVLCLEGQVLYNIQIC